MQQVGIMITNGGPHPAYKLAQMTVDQLVEVSAGASDEARIAGESLRGVFAHILEKHHGLIQLDERKKLKASADRLFAPVTPESNTLDAVIAELMAAAADTPFADHFAKPEVQDYLRRVLTQHFRINTDIERSWFADRNPDKPQAKTFKEARRQAELVTAPSKR